MHDNDADRVAFVDAAAEEAEALPLKRPSDGFADEDDLFDLSDEGFIEPPPKKTKTSTVLPNPAASEALLQSPRPDVDCFFLFQGEGYSFDCRSRSSSSRETSVISSLETFASQYTSLEVDKAQLQKEDKSSSSKLEGAIKMAAEARQEVDSLKEELEGLKKRLKDEEASRITAEARVIEKDDLLRQSSLALLKAADIPVEALDKIPSNSPANALSMTLASHHLVEDLLQKGKGAMARMHFMIFPKIDQNKTLGQLIDAFAVNTKEVIKVFKRTSRTYGALLAFQLMMGHGFKENIEEMSKELPKEQDGRFVDLSGFKTSALKCARQLLELVLARKSSIGPSLSNQTQAP
ncbi:hypothetical protein QYE76_031678 [Lolium multiflorum]|uniref:FRIGIDA-like protein n=1 Tax=Lolium multiflorum TaxID=4521 RepID=A0AAD8QTB5_LOLMU|nr:hypothetical protein QYE76_031678 [Lolium multiflorum]